DMIDLHVPEARRARELPHAGGARLRIRGRIERRLDVRQRDELAWHAVRVEHLVDVVSPDSGANEPGLETVRLPELKAQPARRRAELRVARAFRKQLEHALLLGGEVLPRAVAELREDRAVALNGGLDLAPPGGFRPRVADRLVDDVEALGIVNEAAARVDLGVDAGPEPNRGLDGLWAGKQRLCTENERKREQRDEQAGPAKRFSSHAVSPWGGTTTSNRPALCPPGSLRSLIQITSAGFEHHPAMMRRPFEASLCL